MTSSSGTRYLRLLLLILLFSLAMAAMGAVVVRFGLPEQILAVFLLPIVTVGILHSRTAYLFMLVCFTAVLLSVTYRVAVVFAASLNTVAVTIPTVIVMTEFLRHSVRLRRVAEEALRRSERRYRRLIEESPDGVVLTSRDEIIFANAAAVYLMGTTDPGQLKGKSFYDLVDPEYRMRYLKHEEEVLGEQKSASPLDLRLMRLDGESLDVELKAIPFDYENERGTHIILRDTTSRKRAGEEREKLEAQIQYAQKLESLGVLAGGIAHDFNNLLVGILGNASLSLTELPSDSPYRGPIHQIEVSAHRAAELANEMLAYSGKGQFMLRPLDMTSLLKEMGRLPLAGISKKVDVRYELPAELPAVEGDESQLHQVFLNLLLNASEAIGEDAGSITIRTRALEAKRADLAGTFLDDELPEGDYVSVEICDTGCGMDADVRSRIFEPFFTTKVPGRGLGLAAVLGIVRGHHGALRVESEPNRGSTFTVLLPVAEAEVQPVGRAEASPTVRKGLTQGNGTILVVDDEEIVRNLTERVLSRAGYRILTANDGQEAVDVFHTHADGIDLVLLDMTMPRLSGGEVLRKIRKSHPKARVLLTSGYSEEEVARPASGHAGDGFIQKPYLATELLAKVRGILDG